MSMIGMLREVDPDHLRRLRTDEEAREALCATVHFGVGGLEGSPAQIADAVLLEALPGCWLVPRFLRRWLLGRVLPAGAPRDDDDDDGRTLSLEKDWHLVHAALTGTSDEAPGPAGDAVLGGKEVGDDMGYGPLRLLSPDEVAAVAAFLEARTPASLVKAMDTRALARDEELYGAEWVREGGTREVLELRLGALRTFYRGAAERGSGVALWIT